MGLRASDFKAPLCSRVRDLAPIQLIPVYVRVVVLCVVSKGHLVTKGHFNLGKNSTRFNVHPNLRSSDAACYVWEAYKHFL